ncbi:MAG TPA: DinB family protein [Vicinamibacterales bacterium]|nr:DinB family protein [Vicinamibacterales bacterium]
MKKLWAAALAAALVPAVTLTARQAANPVTTAVRQQVAMHARIMTAAAEEMPADKYSYKPTPAQMSFGHLIMHVGQSNDFLCSKISGEPAPKGPKLTETSPKAELITALKASFSYCDSALGKLDDSTLSHEVTVFGGHSMSRAGAMIMLTGDLADHYSQQAMYLRLNGHLPPTAQRGGMGHKKK